MKKYKVQLPEGPPPFRAQFSKVQYKVDKNVPIPNKCGRGSFGSKYPLDSMQVGDSFFVAEAKATSFSGIIVNFRNKNPDKAAWRFTTRSLEEGGVSGIRMWRIE